MENRQRRVLKVVIEWHNENSYNGIIGEADEKIRLTGGLGDTMLMRKCWVCGAEATDFVLIGKYDKWKESKHYKKQRGYCKNCYPVVMAEMDKDKSEYVRLRKKLMYERAVSSLERQRLDIYDYEEALKAVEDFSRDNPDKFDSSEEMIAAAILINEEISINIGWKVGRYTVDIAIPGMFVLLEIDGETHRSRLYYDNERDKEIRAMLGGKWEIVRIKADYLDQNAEMLVEAIKAVYAEKKKLRSENNGLLPDWYSRREFAKKPKAQEYSDELLLKN